MVQTPDVFLLDEPLGDLDAVQRVEVRRQIVEIVRSLGVPTFYVTHDPAVGLAVADRIAVLDRGAVVQVGTPREVYERPANVFVAGFIGSPAMSVASVQAARDGDGLTLSRGELSLRIPSARVADGVPSEVIMGLRPEHCRLWRDGEGLLGPVAGRTEFVELLGRETLIGVRTGGDLRFSVLAEPDASVRPGDEVRFGVEPGRLHLFDTQTQRAIAVL
jgi:ABC-type sugar transport system ATPase subunit